MKTKDKKGLSAVVLGFIMIGLVIIGAGILWFVVVNMLEQESEGINYDKMCLGLNFKLSELNCVGDDCSLLIERVAGSKADPISGVALIFSNEGESSDEINFDGNIISEKTISASDIGVEGITKASIKIYFIKPDNSSHYCNFLFSS